MSNPLFQQDLEYIVHVASLYKTSKRPTLSMHDFTTALEGVLSELSLKYLKEMRMRWSTYNKTFKDKDIDDLLNEINQEIARRHL